MRGVLTLTIKLWTFESPGGLPSPHFRRVSLILTLSQSRVRQNAWTPSLRKVIKLVNTIFFYITFLPKYSIKHYKPLNHGSNWKAHMLCVTTRLKVPTNDKKSSNTLMTSRPIFCIQNFQLLVKFPTYKRWVWKCLNLVLRSWLGRNDITNTP
jgi:hypothetical protein